MVVCFIIKQALFKLVFLLPRRKSLLLHDIFLDISCVNHDFFYPFMFRYLHIHFRRKLHANRSHFAAAILHTKKRVRNVLKNTQSQSSLGVKSPVVLKNLEDHSSHYITAISLGEKLNTHIRDIR